MPLVDPSFSLLSLHFVVDPGHEFNWEEADDKKMAALELSLRDKVCLLQQYLDVRLIPVPDDSESESLLSTAAAAAAALNQGLLDCCSFFLQRFFSIKLNLRSDFVNIFIVLCRWRKDECFIGQGPTCTQQSCV